MLQVGALVRVRQRHWLVENIELAIDETEADVVTLACVDDDAQGQTLTVLSQAEIDGRVLDENPWEQVVARGFDDADVFSAYQNSRTDEAGTNDGLNGATASRLGLQGRFAS